MGCSFEVEELVSGRKFSCSSGQSVLKAMELSGCQCIPVGCRGGGCGLCKVVVVAGDYECGKMSKRYVTEESQARGEVLACRVYPLSHMVVRACPAGK